VVCGVACVLSEFPGRRAAHDGTAHAAREAYALALDVSARVLPDLQRLRIVAEVDTDLLEDGIGVVLEQLQPVSCEHLVVRDLPCDVRHERVTARGTRGDLGLAATRTPGSHRRARPLLLIHGALWAAPAGRTDRFAACTSPSAPPQGVPTTGRSMKVALS